MSNVADVVDDNYQLDSRDIDVLKIKSARNLLSDGYRTVCSLYALERYNHVEIAQVLEISESTSRSQYYRAKQNIKHCYPLR